MGDFSNQPQPHDFMSANKLSASQLLQERLQERRTKHTRRNSSRRSTLEPQRGRDDDIFLDDTSDQNARARLLERSPRVAASRAESDRGETHGNMSLTGGMKNQAEQMNRLTKENFALKMEVSYRREQAERMQEELERMHAQVSRAQQMEEEDAEVREKLLSELQRRDNALALAADMVNDLENKLADLEDRHSNTRPSTAHADSGYAGTETHEPFLPSSPPRAPRLTKDAPLEESTPAVSSTAKSRTALVGSADRLTSPNAPISFASKESRSAVHPLGTELMKQTQALHPVKSLRSLISRTESRTESRDEDEMTLNSPRLSVLSESSFPSIYGHEKRHVTDRLQWHGDDLDLQGSPPLRPLHSRQSGIKRVSQWMSEEEARFDAIPKANDSKLTMSRPIGRAASRSPTRQNAADVRYGSIADALSTQSDTRADGFSNQPQTDSGPIQQFQPSPRSTKHLTPAATENHSKSFSHALLPSASLNSNLVGTEPAAMNSAKMSGNRIFAPDNHDSYPSKPFSATLNLAPVPLSYSARVQPGAVNATSEVGRHGAEGQTSVDYEDFPDGTSILLGTPSRFLAHPKPPASTFLHDGDQSLQPGHEKLLPRRTKSNAKSPGLSLKPKFNRAETSPYETKTVSSSIKARPKPSDETIKSPRSFHSGSSSARTAVRDDDRGTEVFSDASRPLSQHEKSPTSPGRTVRAFFRRLSNSKEARSEREQSPLPTLTSTPSSAYINALPKEVRRPSLSQQGSEGARSFQRRLSDRDAVRPSIQARTKTEPAARRPASAAPDGSLYDKGDGYAHGEDTYPARKDGSTSFRDSFVPRGSLTRRTNSIRDAATARRAAR